MAAKLKWFGAQFLKKSARQIEAMFDVWWIEVQRIARLKASVPNIGVARTRKRDTSAQGGGKKGSQYTVYPHSSKPGESPRRRTGFGQKNIVGGRQGMGARSIARVGYTAKARYMTYHELGIRYRSGKQQRPTIIPTLSDNRPRLVKLMERAAQRTR